MTIAGTNRTDKIQVCMHNTYGRLERAPGAKRFRIMPEPEFKLRSKTNEYQRVLQGAVPDELIDTGFGRTQKQRCSECLRLHPLSEFVDGLCRGCYCGCGTIDEELAGLRSEYSVVNKWSREMSFFNEIHDVGGGE